MIISFAFTNHFGQFIAAHLAADPINKEVELNEHSLFINMLFKLEMVELRVNSFTVKTFALKQRYV